MPHFEGIGNAKKSVHFAQNSTCDVGKLWYNRERI